MSFNTVSVIGLGYIGLPTAAMFASKKVKVVGVDVNKEAIDIINDGKIHIVEPELDILVHAAVTEGYLEATLKPKPADAFLLAVPTPFKAIKSNEVPEPNLAYIKEACKAISTVLKKGDLVVLESTSPVGTTELVSRWLSEFRKDLNFPVSEDCIPDVFVAHCPERVLPGHVVRELVENDRVIGGITPRCSEKAIELYKIFVNGECIVTNARTAEMAKLTENASRDVSIAFANELSLICDKINIDVWELIALANRHPRVNILQPGPGVGGHCIAVDPWFIVHGNEDVSKLIHTARTINDQKPEWVFSKVKAILGDILLSEPNLRANDLVIACYGIAFKPNIDDIRESPAMEVLRKICTIHRGKILVVEPNLESLPKPLQANNIELVHKNDAITRADIHIGLVGHKEFNVEMFDNAIKSHARTLLTTKFTG